MAKLQKIRMVPSGKTVKFQYNIKDPGTREGTPPRWMKRHIWGMVILFSLSYLGILILPLFFL